MIGILAAFLAAFAFLVAADFLAATDFLLSFDLDFFAANTIPCDMRGKYKPMNLALKINNNILFNSSMDIMCLITNQH